MINSNYLPKSMPNFVFLSNFGNKEYKTREDVIVYISTKYDLPIEDIYVEEFKGMWAGFIREKYKYIVDNLWNELKINFKILELFLND